MQTFAEYMADKGIQLVDGITQSDFASNYTHWLSDVVLAGTSVTVNGSVVDTTLVTVDINQNSANGPFLVNGGLTQDEFDALSAKFSSLFSDSVQIDVTAGKNLKERYYADIDVVETQGPTDIHLVADAGLSSLAGDTVNGGTNGLVIAKLTAADADSAAADMSYEITGGTAGNLFEIVNGNLVLKAGAEIKAGTSISSMTLDIKVTDETNNTFTETFTIISGTGSADTPLNGTSGDDIIFGFNGADKIYGLGGDDILLGMNHKDELYGGDGNDYLFGGTNDDTLYGGNGDDTLYGGTGTDSAYEVLNSETVTGVENVDYIA